MIDPIACAALAVALLCLWRQSVYEASEQKRSTMPETIIRHEIVHVPYQPPVRPADAPVENAVIEQEIVNDLDLEEFHLNFPEMAQASALMRGGGVWRCE